VLRITVLTDAGSWINPLLESFVERCLDRGHRVRWVHDVASLVPGDVCFILSFSAILREEALRLHRHNLVVHASALPAGRGWSPMTWQILEGRHEFTLTLFEATPRVDAGVIYAQKTLRLEGHELADEWRRAQVAGIAGMCADWIAGYPASLDAARPQQGEPSFYARRTPADSALDPQQPLAAQFDKLRVVDNDHYPAWFEFRGHRYVLTIKEKP
jgi:methionyl-tRNA formyltransferase